MTPPPSAPAAATAGPRRLAGALVATTVLLITFGAMVTSTGSGLAFSDWPLSDGELMPDRALHTPQGFLEHFHRVIGAAVGLMMLVLMVWVGVRERQRPGLRRLCVFALALVVVQGIFGGVGVRLMLPAYTSITHGVLAQVTLATFALVAFALAPDWAAIAARPGPAHGRKPAVAAIVLVLVQALIGAVARHTDSDSALWIHVGNALVVFFVIVIAAGIATGRLGDVPGMRPIARRLLTLLVVQVVLGFAALLVRTGKHPENIARLWTSALISAHVLVGALLTLQSVLLGARVFRATRGPASA